MEQATEAKAYRSPAYKLRAFFERSRDRWKKKAIERTRRIKRLMNRIEGLKASRGKWKKKAKALQAQIAELKKELEQQKNASP